MNAFSQRNYRGFNTLLLSSLSAKNNYPFPLFGTFKQISEAGGRVKRGEKSFPIIFWKVGEDKKLNEITGVETEVKYFTPFYYNVFNLAQTENLDLDKYVVEPKINNPLETCETVIANMSNRPQITHDDQSGAYYSPFRDLVNVPEIRNFDGSEEYYSVMFHELAHSTGHSSRLNRFKDTDAVFGAKSYNYEELVAEMTATMLCSHCGIEQTVDNSVAYLTGWAQFLKNERKTTLFGAATKAQAAVDFILGNQLEQPENEIVLTN
jgi:antirestriction protein ArdC